MFGFNLTKLPALLSFVKEADKTWESLELNDREKVDALMRKGLELIPTPEALDPARKFLLEGTDPLPARIAGALAHPSTREYLTKGKPVIGHQPLEEEVRTGLIFCPDCQSPITIDV